MKNICLAFFGLLTISIYSQQTFQGKAVYKSKTAVNMNFGGKQLSDIQKKRFAEKMKTRLEKTFVLSFTKTASLYEEEKSLSAPTARFGGKGGGKGNLNSLTGIKYKNIKEGIVLEELELLGKKFLVTDNGDKPAWILGSETKKIGNYICYKATLKKEIIPLGNTARSFAGKGKNRGKARNKTEKKPQAKSNKVAKKTVTVTAWYSPQIPVAQGPGEYWGLPGLILEINEDKTTILCSEIVLNSSGKIEIKAPKKGKKISREDFRKLAAKKMVEMKGQFKRKKGGKGRGKS